MRKRKSLPAGLVLLVAIIAMGVSGSMENEDACKVEEFRQEVMDAQAQRESCPLRTVHEPAMPAIAAR